MAAVVSTVCIRAGRHPRRRPQVRLETPRTLPRRPQLIHVRHPIRHPHRVFQHLAIPDHIPRVAQHPDRIRKPRRPRRAPIHMRAIPGGHRLHKILAVVEPVNVQRHVQQLDALVLLEIVLDKLRHLRATRFRLQHKPAAHHHQQDGVEPQEHLELPAATASLAFARAHLPNFRSALLIASRSHRSTSCCGPNHSAHSRPSSVFGS